MTKTELDLTGPTGWGARLADQARDLAARLTGDDRGTCRTCEEPVVRVGTDLQQTVIVDRAVRDHGSRYLDRVYTVTEQADALGGACPRPGSPWPPAAVSALTARYAAKEAVTKVLRPVDTGVPWLDVEVVSTLGGWCRLLLHGQASARAHAGGLSAWDLSLSHDGPLAVATVVAVHTCHSTMERTPRGT